MKSTIRNSYILASLLFLFIFTTVIGAFSLSFQRNVQAELAKNINSVQLRINKLERDNIELKTKIANFENPNILRMKVGQLKPVSDNTVVWAGYENFEGGRVETSTDKKLVLSFKTPTRIGTIESVNR